MATQYGSQLIYEEAAVSKVAVKLQTNISVPTVGARSWQETGGRVYSVDAALAAGSTDAVVTFWGTNSRDGLGVLIATITLSNTTRCDGSALSESEGSYFWLASEVSSVTGGALASASALVQLGA